MTSSLLVFTIFKSFYLVCFYLQLQVYVYNNIVHIFAEKMFFIVTVITEGTQGDKLMAILLLEQFYNRTKLAHWVSSLSEVKSRAIIPQRTKQSKSTSTSTRTRLRCE